MLKLNTIRAQVGSVSKNKRLGRGRASGRGGTAGKGHKGQSARAGGGVRIGFEGGQTPLYRRLPKVGFTNFFRRSKTELNVGVLETFDPSEVGEVTLENLKKAGKIRGSYEKLVILGDGEITKAFTVKAHRVSSKAKEKITAAGGKVEIIPIVRHSRKIAEARKSANA